MSINLQTYIFRQVYSYRYCPKITKYIDKMNPQQNQPQQNISKPSVSQVPQVPQIPQQVPQFQQIPMAQQYQQIPPLQQMSVSSQIPQFQQIPQQVPQFQFPTQSSPEITQSYTVPMPYGANYQQFDSYSEAASIALLGKDDAEYMKAKTAAIIVSICSGSSYDNLFTSVKQKSQEGTKTMVFAVSGSAVDLLIAGFEGKSEDQTVKILFKEMAALEPDCIVFNWECSSGYTSQTFPEGADKVMKLVDYVIKGKHMAMFSDFSLKALIANWSEALLGPNPFQKMSQEFSDTVQLRFDPHILKESPSAQLQSVGDLSEGGLCNVHCLGGTIIYSLNKKNTDTNRYRLEILTVAENAPTDNSNFLLHIKTYKGAAGHILLTYPNTGKLLTSMTHWMELVKVDTSEQKLFEMAQKQYGTQEVQKMQSEMASLSQPQRAQYVQRNAQAYVQTSAPCNNFVQKAAYNQYK